MFCPLNLAQRKELFGKISDMLDINDFVNVWSNDDFIVSIMLGGLPSCIEDMLFESWKDLMIVVSTYIKSWNYLFRFKP